MPCLFTRFFFNSSVHSLLWLILARKSSPVLDHTLSCLSTLLTPPHPNPNPTPRHDECAVPVCAWVDERSSPRHGECVLPVWPWWRLLAPHPTPDVCVYTRVKFECVWVRRWVPDRCKTWASEDSWGCWALAFLGSMLPAASCWKREWSFNRSEHVEKHGWAIYW